MQKIEQCKTELIQFIHNLPDEKIIELFDFARFLVSQYSRRRVSQVYDGALLLQQQALCRIWDNPEEDLYEI